MTTIALSPLEVRAAEVRQQAFAAVTAKVCHDHRAAVGAPCWVEPNPAVPTGPGNGVGFLPGMDTPVACSRRRAAAARAAEEEQQP